MSYERITKDCYYCHGLGYKNITITRYEYNYMQKRNELKTYIKSQRCFKCKSSGQIIDQYAQKKRKQQKIENQKWKNQKEFNEKQQRFEQYVRKYKQSINQPLLQGIKQISEQYAAPSLWQTQKVPILTAQKQQGMTNCRVCEGTGYQKKYLSQQVNICSNCKGSGNIMLQYNKHISRLKIKSEKQLRKQFEKMQEEQRVKKQIKQWKQNKQIQQKRKKAELQEWENKRKQKQQKDRQWQQFIKTPQGIKQMKKQQRLKKINYCVQKICCGPPSWKRVIQWIVILSTLSFVLYFLLVFY